MVSGGRAINSVTWRSRLVGRLKWWDLALVVCLVAVGLVRFRILQSGGAPPTIDAGNWLAFADGMLGRGVRSSTIVYPPVVPLLTKAFVVVLGTTGGVSMLAALSSLAPATGVYLGLRHLGLEAGALIPSLLLLGSSAVAEATAWGGFPQLIGLGLTPIVLIAIDKWLRSWSVRDALVAGVALMALLATSHFIGLTVVAAAAVMVVMALVAPIGSAGHWRKELLSLGLVMIPLLWLVPLYLSLGETLQGASRDFRSLNQLTWSNLLEHVEFLYRDFPWVWRPVLSGLVVTPLLLMKRHHTTLWRVATSLLIAVVVVTSITREGRFLYFLTVMGALGVALWVENGASFFEREGRAEAAVVHGPKPMAPVVMAVLLVVIGWQAIAGLNFFRSQRDFYGILTPGLVEGIEYVRDMSDGDVVVAVTSLNDAPLGWWVEAITRREVIYGSPLRWLAFDDELERASLANTIFAPPFPTEEKLRLAEDAGIDLIIVPTRWGFYDGDAMDALTRESQDLVAFLNTDSVVVQPNRLDED